MKNTKKNKKMFLEQLAKSAVIQIACEKTGIGKSTIYRWQDSDKEFAKQVEEAISEGNNLVTDLAKAQLISIIKDKNFNGLKFWLQSHSSEFVNKTHLEIEGNLNTIHELSPEQKELVRKSLTLADMLLK